jgi:hypothetical protein
MPGGKMAFYAIKDTTSGLYLSILENAWVGELREAAIFSRRSTALSTIRGAWRDRCMIERIIRLPDRPRPLRSGRVGKDSIRALR